MPSLFLKEQNFFLPKWAYWSKDLWTSNHISVTEIFEKKLGWDITDFGL